MKRTIVAELSSSGSALLLGNLGDRGGKVAAGRPFLFPSPWTVADTFGMHCCTYASGGDRGHAEPSPGWLRDRRRCRLPLGLLMGSSQLLEDTVGLLALGLQTLPSVCWVPLAFSGSGRPSRRCCSWWSWGRCGRSSSRPITALAPFPRSMRERLEPWVRKGCTFGSRCCCRRRCRFS